MSSIQRRGVLLDGIGSELVRSKHGGRRKTLSSWLGDIEAGVGAAFVDVASAATVDLGAVDSDAVRITGTTTITSFGVAAAGVRKKIRFAGALTLTYNATSLILPGDADITTAADDYGEAISLGSSNWYVGLYQRSNFSSNLVTATGSTEPRNLADRFGELANVKDYGAIGDGVTDDTAAILLAYDAIAATGGVMYFPPGTYLVSNLDAPAASWDNDYAIRIEDNDIHLYGAGREVTTLKLANTADCHVIKIGQRTGGTILVDNCSIQHLTIDGNRTNQATPTDTDDHWQGIDVSSYCTNIRLAHVKVHDCAYYGIGFQSEGFEGCSVFDVIIEDVGADGLDWKNDDSTGFANTIDYLWVRRHGLLSGLTLSQAGLDIRSGVTATHVYVEDYGSAKGLIGIRAQRDLDSNTAATQDSQLSHFFTRPTTVTSTVGLRVDQLRFKASHGKCRGAGTNVWVSQRECVLAFVDADVGTDGIQFTTGSNGTNADDCAAIACNARGNTQEGIVIDGVLRTTLLGCAANANAEGIEIRAGTTDARVLGGTVTGNSTADFVNAGTDTKVFGCEGAADYLSARAVRTVYVLAQSAVAVSHTGDTTETTLATISLPAGILGPNGRVRVTSVWSWPNSANTKTTRLRLNGLAGTAYLNTSGTTSVTAKFQTEIANRNAQNSQVGGTSSGASGGWGASTTAHVTSAVDTSVAVDLVLTGQLANSGETITLESYLVEVIYGA